MLNASSPVIVRSGENRLGKVLNIFGDKISVKVAGADTGGRFAVFEGTTEPEAGPPLHVHTREDEWFCVLEGQFRFEADGQQHVLSAGDTLFIPRGIPHTFQNAGEAKGRVMVMVQPAGLERFFEELADATAEMPQPDMNVVVPIFSKYGLEILGPPLAARSQAAQA